MAMPPVASSTYARRPASSSVVDVDRMPVTDTGLPGTSRRASAMLPGATSVGPASQSDAGVAVGDRLAPASIGGTGSEVSDCAIGAGWTNASAALELLSLALPYAPPGNLSRLAEAGGALPGEPSTKSLVASPQLSESSVAPSTTRSTTDPPLADSPPL